MARVPRIPLRRFLITTCIGLIVWTIAYMLSHRALTIESGEVKGDALIVLGGADDRAERAAELYKEGAAPRVVVSGFGDCAWNKQTLINNGVPASAISTESTSLSTLENVKRSLPLLRQLGAHRVIIVTSWFHSRRAMACFQHFAPDIKFYSRPSYVIYSPEHRNRQTNLWYVSYEYVKLIGYWVVYGVSPFGIKTE